MSSVAYRNDDPFTGRHLFCGLDTTVDFGQDGLWDLSSKQACIR